MNSSEVAGIHQGKTHFNVYNMGYLKNKGYGLLIEWLRRLEA